MNDIVAAVEAELPGVLADLTRLVAIPSISADPARRADVAASASAVAELFSELGAEVEVVSEDGGQPAVIARFDGPTDAPRVCLYAHHDVQPTGDVDLWATDPFTVTPRGDRLFGRGVCDDKAGVAVHLAALRAWGGRPPAGVTVFVEGEEESGSPTLGATLDAHRDAIASDVFVITDSGNWAVGRPAFTTSLRGLASVVVEVSTLDHALHSGQYGGVVPDALTTLCKLLGTLHDDDGEVAIAGLDAGSAAQLDYPEARLRDETGVLDGVRLVGRGPVVDRLWAKPAVAVIGLDATPVAKASNTLIPSARAEVSVRLAPGQDPDAALAALKTHLTSHVPFGATVTFGTEGTGRGSVIPFEGPAADAAFGAFTQAWGVEPVFMGQGGSIPMVAEFLGRFPGSTVLVTGVCDPDSRMHAIDESLHLGDFRAACVAEALLLGRLAQTGGRSA